MSAYLNRHRRHHRRPDAAGARGHHGRRSSRSAATSRPLFKAASAVSGSRLIDAFRAGARSAGAKPSGARSSPSTRRRTAAAAAAAKRRRPRRPRTRGRNGRASRERPRETRSRRRRGRAPPPSMPPSRPRRPPPLARKSARVAAPALPLEPADPTLAAPVERRMGGFTLPPLALLDAPKAERKIDERELMEGARLLEEKCREFSVEGTRRADPPGPGRHDVRVQARRRREVQQDHRPRRRSVPGDAGRVGPHRSPARQVHGRHPDAEPDPRADLAARAAGVGGLPALPVEADAGARQDDPRRAVPRRPGDDAAPAHRRLHRHRQVGRPERDARPASSIARRRTMCG